MRTRFFVLLFFSFSLILAEEAAPLKMVSYNIRHGEGMDGKIDLVRLAKIIAREKPDLVALQEVDQNCKRSGGVDQAAELGKLLKMDHRFGKFMDFQGGEYGMAVLSRLPIQESTRHVLPAGAEPRCALEILVQPQGWEKPLSFIGIHNDWTQEEIRVRQVGDLLTKLNKKDHAIILSGDFNAELKSDSLKLLTNDGWKTLRKESAATFPADKPSVEIDFFIAKNIPRFSYQDEIIDEMIASDHRPIAVEITLGSSSPKQ